MRIQLFLAIISCYYLVFTVYAEEQIVTIKDGKIEGETLKSFKGREYSAFAGIPYAKPPIGDLRFVAPQPNEPWEGTLKTSTQNATRCSQSSLFTNELIGQEDCLYINVYTPKISEEKIPVMVFIHGGGFNTGSGAFQDYGPQRLMDKNVVLVTLNYRLGPTGFFAYPSQGLLGNYGLLDQIAALKWVQENIEAFGGDKDKVTIFGESAGGASVVFLLLSPLAKDLFHGAIVQSGSALCDWAVNTHPEQCARFLSIKLNCTTFPIESMLKCLRQKPWKEIFAKNKEFEIFPMIPIIQKPNVDGNAVPDKPITLLQEGKVNPVPVILGTNSEEGAIFVSSFRKLYPRTGEVYLKEDLPEILSLLSGRMEGDGQILENVRQKYFNNVDVSDKTAFNRALVKVFSDSAFSCVQRTAQYIANSTGHPTYVYTFSHRGQYSLVQSEPGEDLGVAHADELQYLFQGGFFPLTNFSDNDGKMSEILLSLWTNFAKSQNPTPHNEDDEEDDDDDKEDKLQFSWPEYKTEDPKCVNLNLNSSVTNICESEHTNYWAHDSHSTDTRNAQNI